MSCGFRDIGVECIVKAMVGCYYDDVGFFYFVFNVKVVVGIFF